MRINILLTTIAIAITTTISARPGSGKSISSPLKMDKRSTSIQPGIGIRPNFGKDMMLTNLLISNKWKYISVAAHSAFSLNGPFPRSFNYIRTNYNYSISQTVGIGHTFTGKRAAHSLLLMAGVKYYNFKQTMENPQFEKVSTSVSSLDPDMGFRYNFAYGAKKCFFHAGLYIPLFPYPIKTANIDAADGNLKNISLEAGIGIKL